MDWTDAVFEVIDMRSFSNLWYWIALGVFWSAATQRTLGIPQDLVVRARRGHEPARRNLQDHIRINVDRMLWIADAAGLWLVAGSAALVTGIAILAFWYWVEFAQALFFLVLPAMILGALDLRAARRIRAGELDEPGVFQLFARMRLTRQALGVVFIFATAVFGMYQNLTIGAI